MKLESLAEKLRKTQGVQNSAPHLIIEARAGTGKTTTLVEALNILKTGNRSFAPSPQQQAICDAICLPQPEPRTVCFVAFNKSIATELQQRVPDGCDAMTMHSMGFHVVKQAYGLTSGGINQYRVRDLTAEVLGYKDSFELRRYHPEFLNAVEKLVSLCKMNLIDPTSFFRVGNENNSLQELVSHYDIDLNGGAAEIFETVPKVLERCKDVSRDRQLDFDDMVWLPVVLNLNVYRYDLLLVDEAQDLNRCQQQLAIKAGRRLILCGDPKQGIYGFAGADSESMPRMETLLLETKLGCKTLPLNVTRRCGRAIVREAQKIVPDFEAHETCSDGLVTKAYLGGPLETIDHALSLGACKGVDIGTDPIHRPIGYECQIQDGDMVLCRVNAPLVSECFKFLRVGRKATIQGRDVGQGLISTIQKLIKHGPIGPAEPNPKLPDEIETLIVRLSDWLHKEERTENAKRNPSDARLIALQDKHDCITCFTEDCETVKEVTDKIEAVFNDNETDGIKLSSVHKAKGLEARRVFILQPEGATMPHPMARSPWQREQEMNLLYVAITRARDELIYVQ